MKSQRGGHVDQVFALKLTVVIVCVLKKKAINVFAIFVCATLQPFQNSVSSGVTRLCWGCAPHRSVTNNKSRFVRQQIIIITTQHGSMTL